MVDRKREYTIVSDIKKPLRFLPHELPLRHNESVGLQAFLIRFVPLVFREEVGVFPQCLFVLTYLRCAHFDLQNNHGVASLHWTVTEFKCYPPGWRKQGVPKLVI
jgi:hypothetical protein